MTAGVTVQQMAGRQEQSRVLMRGRCLRASTPGRAFQGEETAQGKVSEEEMSLAYLQTEVQGLAPLGAVSGGSWGRVLQALLYSKCRKGSLEDYR